MPTYQVTDPQTGTQLQLDGDSPPTEAELTQIFAQSKGTAPIPTPAHATVQQPPSTVPALAQKPVDYSGLAALATPQKPPISLPPVKRAVNTRTGGYAPAPDSGLPPSLGQMQFDAAQKAVTQTIPGRIWDLAKGAAWDFPYKAGEVIRDTATGFGTTIGEDLFPPDGDMANTQEKGINLTKKALGKGVEEAKGLIPFRSTLEKTVLKGALKGFSLAAKDASTSADLDAQQGKIHPLYDLAQEAIADPLGTGAQAAMFLGAAAHLIDSAAPEVGGRALNGFRPIPREDAAAPIPPPIQAPPAEPAVSDAAPPSIDTGTTPVRVVRDSSGKVQLIPTGPDIPPDAPSAAPEEAPVNRATSPVETPVPALPSDSLTGPKTPVESPASVSDTPSEDWQKTQDEYGREALANFIKDKKQELSDYKSGKGTVGPFSRYKSKAQAVRSITEEIKNLSQYSPDEIRAQASDHYGIVRRAIEAGKPVPPQVMQDYPDLQPPAPETPVPALAPATPLTRNFTAGTKSGSITFDSELQKDLYDTGARLRKLQKDAGTRGVPFDPVDAAALKSKIASIQQRTNMSHAEVATLARDVHDDVRMQMKGVGDGEARTVTDNVIQRSLGNRTPPSAPVETPKTVPALAPEPAPPLPPQMSRDAMAERISKFDRVYGDYSGLEAGSYSGTIGDTPGRIGLKENKTPVNVSIPAKMPDGTFDFVDGKKVPSESRTEAHEIMHDYYTRDPVRGKAAADELTKLHGYPNDGSPFGSSFEGLMDLGAFYALDLEGLKSKAPEYYEIAKKWLGDKPISSIEDAKSHVAQQVKTQQPTLAPAPEALAKSPNPTIREKATKVSADLEASSQARIKKLTKGGSLFSGEAAVGEAILAAAEHLAHKAIDGVITIADSAAYLKQKFGEKVTPHIEEIIKQARTIVATHAGAMDFAGMREDKTGQSAADIVRAFQADDPSIARNKGPRLKDSEVRQLAEDLDLTPKQLLENPAMRGKDAVEAAKLRGYAQGAVEWVKEAQEKHFKERTPETQAELHAATEMARALVEAASGRATEAGRTLRQYRMTVEAINYRSAKEEAAAEMFPGGKHDTSEEAQIAKPIPKPRASAGTSDTGRETPVPKEKTPRSPSTQGTPTTRRPPKPSFGSILRQKIETDPGIVKARESFFASLRRTHADIPFAPGIHAIPELVNLAREYIRVGVESYSEWHGDVANRMTPEEYRKHTEENWRQSWAAAGGKVPGEAPVPKPLERGAKPPSQTQMDFGEEADFSKASTLYLPEEARSSLQSLRDIQTKSGKPPAFDAVTKSKLTRIGGYLYETGKAEGMRNFDNWSDYMQKLLSKNIRGIAEANPTADATHKFESVSALASGEKSIPASVLEEVWRNLPRDAEARVRQAATIRQQAVNAMNAAMGKGNADSLLRRLDRIKEFDDKGVPNPDYHRQIMHLVKESRKAGIIETALQLSKAGLISSSRVLLKINASHAAYLTTEEIAKIPAAFLDAARVGINTARGVESSRTIALPRMTDIRRAMRIAKEARSEAKIIALKGEQGLRDAGIPDRFQGKGNTDILHTEHYSGDSAMSKTVDWLINQTYRLHGADYHIMKTFAYEKALAENARVEAINEARTQGLPSSYIEPRVKELLANPPEHTVAQALYDMEVATFINQNKMSNLLTDAKFKYGLGMRVGADIAAPFPRIPTNVVARTMEYHPAGTALGFVEHLVQNLESHAPYGEWKPEQVRALTRIFGRSSVGTGAMALGAFLAAKNLLIPSDIRTGEKGSLRLYNPKSGKWDRKAQIGGIGGPLFAMLMSGANYYDLATQDTPTKAEDWWSATASPLAELPLVSGAELVSSLKEGKGVEGIVAGQASSRLIPSLLSDTAKTFDKYERERSLSGDGPGIKALRAKALAHPEGITKEQRDIIKQYDALKANADASAGTRSGFWGGMGGALKDTRDLTGNFLQARIPGLSNKLPPKLDRTGEPIPSSYALVDPYAIGKQTPEQESVVLRQEIARKMTEGVKEKNKKSTPGRLNYDIRPEDKIFKSFVASLKGLDVEQLREYARTGVDPRSKIQSVRPTSMTPASIGR